MSELVNEVLTAIGGIGVILLGLFAYLKQIQLARYESELTETRDKLNKIMESEVHAKKAIFDKEFGIYEELWELMTELEHETHKLLHEFTVSSELVGGENNHSEAKYNFIQYFNSVIYKVKKYSPFIPPELTERIDRSLGMFKWTVQTVEVNGNEAQHLQILEENLHSLRNQIEGRIKEYIANV